MTETRVGYMTVDRILTELEQSIRTYSVNSKYEGPVEWIDKYRMLNNYLDKSGHNFSTPKNLDYK